MLTIQLPTFPELTSERLVLRQLRPADAEQVFLMRSDPHVMQHVPRPLAQSVQDAHDLIDHINTAIAQNEGVQWAITVKGEDTLAGIIGFWRLEKENHLAELGYMLLPTHWGRGLVSEAIATAVHYGFHTLGFHKIVAITRPQNVASMRALEKNGFLREGLLRANILWNGEFHDSVYYGRVVTDGA